MKENRKEKILYYCDLFAAFCFLFNAVIWFFSQDGNVIVFPQLCLGAAFLGLASTHKKGAKEA